MILSAVFSKPVKNVESIFGKAYTRIKFSRNVASIGKDFFVEKFTETQVFHEHIDEAEANEFIKNYAGTIFRSCVVRTEDEIITTLSNKKGKITRLRKPFSASFKNACDVNSENLYSPCTTHNRKKNYLLQEGVAIPFLVLLGVMTSSGKIVSAKYNKFKQINRFLEFIDDVADEICKNENRTIRILDFGSGKSYLTFAVQYYFEKIKKRNATIVGIDVKRDVVSHCNEIAKQLGLKNIFFEMGEIANYKNENDIDIVIALHACDTATDDALLFAVTHNAKAILAVPCCQHEVNAQTSAEKADENFSPFMRYGFIKEKFSSLTTDVLRALFLEANGYEVQAMEFISMEHTPKNILLRAIKTRTKNENAIRSAKKLCASLDITQTLISKL